MTDNQKISIMNKAKFTENFIGAVSITVENPGTLKTSSELVDVFPEQLKWPTYSDEETVS